MIKSIKFLFFLFFILFNSIGIAALTERMKTIDCMAKNIYFEARNQSLAGQIAITYVVFNRVLDARYPNSICEVIQQGPKYAWNTSLPVRDKCQFSWFCDGRSDIPMNKAVWKTSLVLAEELFDLWKYGTLMDITEGSTHYHAHYVSPNWGITKIMQIQAKFH